MGKKLFQIIFINVAILAGAVISQSAEKKGDGNDNPPTLEDSYDRQVIPGDRIKSAGIVRLRDLFRLIDGWHYYSTDRINWFAGVRGMTPYSGQDWEVMIDGHLMDFQIMDQPYFHAAHIIPEEIEKIEVISRPQVHEGRFTDRGLIHIHTERPEEGFSVQARAMMGQEVNEPGPYEYTPLRTKNEEATGIDPDILLSWGGENWFLQAGYGFREDKNTDKPIESRMKFVRNVPDEPTDAAVYGNTVSVRSGLELENSSHHFRGGFSRLEDYAFIGPLGMEYPVYAHHRQIGVNGTFQLNPEHHLHYRSHLSRRGLDYRYNVFDLDFDQWLNSSYANFEYAYQGMFSDFTFGITAEQEYLDTDYELSDSERSLLRGYTSSRVSITEQYSQNINLAVNHDGEDWSVQSAIEQIFQAGEHHTLTAGVHYSGRMPSEFHGFWYWAEQGYDVLGQRGINYIADGPLQNQEVLGVDVSWRWSRAENFNIVVNPFHRRLSGFWQFRQSYDLDNRYMVEAGDVQLLTEGEMQVAGANISLDWQLAERLSTRLHYSLQSLLDAPDTETEELWQMHPDHQASAKVSYTPVDGFSLWANFLYSSPTEWVNYDEIDGAEFQDTYGFRSSRYRSRVPAKYSVDVAGRKSFFNQRVHTTVKLRNVINQRYRYHPLGADYDLAMYLMVSYGF